MDDYFHLNLKKFNPDAEAPSAPESPESPESSSMRPEPGENKKTPDARPADLELAEPVVVEDTSDPYNSTGRFNVGDLNW